MIGVDAAAYLAHLRTVTDVVEGLGPDVVIAWHPAAAPRRVGRRLGRGGSTTPSAPFTRIERGVDGEPDTVVPVGPGAAVASVTVELLAELGARRIVGVGIAGSVGRPALGLGRVVVAGALLGDEGTSRRYPETAAVEPDLRDDLARWLDAPLVSTHSTAAPFRAFDHAPPEPTVVEMEARAQHAVAAALGLTSASAFVVSDVATDGGWEADHPGRTAEAVRTLADDLRRLLAEAAG